MAEINNMGATYKNSTLAIAAMNLDDVYKGFLTTPSKFVGFKLLLRLLDSTMGSIILVDWKHFLVSTLYKGGPLALRGRALQEFLLSPRVLLFGARDIRW